MEKLIPEGIMVLVFILFGIVIFLLTLFILLLLSTIRIEIKNLKIGNKEVENQTRIKDNYEVKIGVYFLEKIPILWIRLNNKKVRKIYHSKRLEKIDLKKIETTIPFNKQTLQIIKQIKIRISKLNLQVAIGTEDAVLTSYLVAIIASVIGILLPHLINKNSNYYYKVNPLYQNKNEYHIDLDSIICIKIVHIIDSMLFLLKKGRDKNERTSNRRSYAYRYE